MDWINSGQFTFSCSFGMIVLIISIIPLEPSWLNDSLCSDSKIGFSSSSFVNLIPSEIPFKLPSISAEVSSSFWWGISLFWKRSLFAFVVISIPFSFWFWNAIPLALQLRQMPTKIKLIPVEFPQFFFFFLLLFYWRIFGTIFFLFRKFNPIVSNRFRFSWIFLSFAAFRCLRHVENWYFAVWTRSISYRFSSFRLNFFNLCIVFEYLGSEKRIELLENRYDFNWILFQSNKTSIFWVLFFSLFHLRLSLLRQNWFDNFTFPSFSGFL